MDVFSLSEACEIFKNAVRQKNVAQATTKLTELKMAFLSSESNMSSGHDNTAKSQRNAIQNLRTGFFECAVLFSVDCNDKESFQRYMSSLRPLYTMQSDQDAISSELKCIILGINLLNLLVENKLSEFHCELELLDDSHLNHPAILFCTQLDQHLMMGSYDQVLLAAAKPPTEYYIFFLKSLMKTVRINIGDGITAAYRNLSIPTATKLLMFQTDEETLAFIEENYPTWLVDLSTKLIIIQNKAVEVKSEEIPSLKLINQQLTYASEIERIV